MEKHLSGRFSFLLLIIVFLMVSGCAKPGAKYSTPVEIPSGKSVVYFYRQAHPLGTMAMPGIKSNGQEILYILPTWSWWPYYIEPGDYHFEPKLFGLYKKDSVNITSTKPGETFYVRASANIGYIGLNLVDQSQAVEEMKKCYLVDGKPQDIHKTSSQEDKQPSPSSLEMIEPKSARLYVATNPSDARIRIMNIKPKFSQGIELEPGKYKIETTSPGFTKDLRWIEIKENGDFKLSVTLNKK